MTTQDERLLAMSLALRSAKMIVSRYEAILTKLTSLSSDDAKIAKIEREIEEARHASHQIDEALR